MSSAGRTECLVIGSGPGGAVTARLLAEAGRDVLIVEEGPDLQLESAEPFSVDEMRQKYRYGALNPVLGHPNIALVEGCTVGGGSEINSGLYHRTPTAILESWRRDFRVEHLTALDMEPHFRSCDEAVNVVKIPVPKPALSLKLAQGAERLGWTSIEVPRCFRYDGRVGPDGVPLGTRQSMTRTILPRARAAGANLLPLFRALRPRAAGRQWKLEGLLGSRPVTITADRVFVCGGAIESPALLRRSGVRTNTGNSLAMHPSVKIAARFPDEINHEEAGVPVHQVKHFEDMSFGCAISSLPYLMMGMIDYPAWWQFTRREWRRMGMYYGMIPGPSCGTVRNIAGSTDPRVRYPLRDADLRLLATALQRLARMLLGAGATHLFASIEGFPPIRTEADISHIPAILPRDRANLMTIHLFGSCPMGEDLSRCAVDSFGRVHGVPGLSVHDASIFCSAPNVNPQGTVMALAHRCTRHFLGQL